ncbi:M23 family metallopeptidase [Wenjunlia tyrosinilytica]|uniref:M23ase beta-sheet core domain-containing protein n=1 Tax=Wenjunlia tyrosinilytica TaxID=1544741 RepID=A0A917ZSE6_9ACTN|nr:M23 family metallopeptidase [Wenjunlia tyrosinilytica]GGO89574.1 hypothetical protein GCM10012280_33060 [Wenjunlia tyrosinilytica]
MRKTIDTARTALASSKRLRIALATTGAAAVLTAVPFAAAATEGDAPQHKAPTAAAQPQVKKEAAKPAAKPKAKPAAKPAAKPKAKPAKPAAKPKAKPAAKPVQPKKKDAVKDRAVQASVQKRAEVVNKAAPKKASRAEHRAPMGWDKPVDRFTLSAGFNQGGAHWAHKHSGQDFAVPIGTPVHSVHEGTVVQAGWGGAYGNNIVIKHADGRYSQYGHLSKLQVHAGQHVSLGQQIGLSGNTGNSTGPHLHFEIRNTPVYGSAIEPLSFLRDHGVNV